MIISIVGKTASGKDTAADYISNKYGIPKIVSATTRPMRVYEKNGREHWFVTPLDMMHIRKRDDVIAYTRNPDTGIEYAATLKMFPQGTKDCIYIIKLASWLTTVTISSSRTKRLGKLGSVTLTSGSKLSSLAMSLMDLRHSGKIKRS